MTDQYRIVFFLLLLASTVLYAQNPLGAKRFSNQMMHSRYSSFICLSPDGRYGLSGDDSTLKLWNISTEKEIRTWGGTTYGGNSGCFSPDGRYALVGGSDKYLKLWDVSTGRAVRTFTGNNSSISSVCFSLDGHYALSGSHDNTIKLWEVSSGKEIRTFIGNNLPVSSVCFSPDGKYALSAGYEVKLWEVSSGKEVRTFTTNNFPGGSICFSSDGRYGLSAGKEIHLWEINTGQLVRTFENRGNTSWVSLSPDSHYALSTDAAGNNYQWNVSTGRVVRRFTKKWYGFDGNYNTVLKLWEINEAKKGPTLSGHDGPVPSLSFSADGRYVLTSGYDKKVKLWDVGTGKEIRTFGVRGTGVYVKLSADGHYALTTGYNGNNWFAKVWDVNTGKEVRSLAKNSYVCDLSSDSRYMLIRTNENNNSSLNLLSISTGKKIYTFAENNHTILPCLSADSRYALSGSDNKTLELWSVNTDKVIQTFTGHTDEIYSLCLSHDGRYVLSGSKDKVLKLWNISTGQEIHSFIGHTGSVHTICMSPDGRYALSGSDDRTVKLWDVSRRKELKSWAMNFFPIKVAFTPDGSGVLVGTTAYFVSFPVPKSFAPKPVVLTPTPLFSQLVESIDTKPISPTLSTPVFSQIIWRSNPTTVHEPAYSAQAAFVSNYANPIQASHIRVYVNGQLQAGGQKMGIVALKANQGQGRYNWQQTLPLQKGENEIVLGLALPNQPEVLSEPLTITYLPPTLPNLYVVSIGIPGQGLTYAGDDAEAVGQLLKQQQGKLFNRVITRFLNRPEQISTTNLRNEMSQLPLYDITPNDVLIIFASAHGKKINLRNRLTDFALQPNDYNSANISTEENTTLLYKGHILDNIESIACKKLILLDACHSGEAVLKQGGKSQYLRDLRDAQATVKRTSPGLITLSSSNDGQLSWEDDTWQHGAFTKALLDGLTGAADTIDPITSRKDGFVFVSELFSYLQKAVPSLVSKVKKEEQQPQMYPAKLAASADFPLVQY